MKDISASTAQISDLYDIDTTCQNAEDFKNGFLYAIKRLEAIGLDISAENLKEIYDKEVSKL